MLEPAAAAAAAGVDVTSAELVQEATSLKNVRNVAWQPAARGRVKQLFQGINQTSVNKTVSGYVSLRFHEITLFLALSTALPGVQK